MHQINEQGDGSALRVGCWPTRSDNPFIGMFNQMLEAEGIEVVPVNGPSEIDRKNFDVLQIHWAEQVYWHTASPLKKAVKAGLLMARLVYARLRGLRITWLVHNLEPHDSSKIDRWIWNVYSGLLAKLIDGMMTLSPATLPIVTSRYGYKGPQFAFHHPPYPAASKERTKTEARRELGLKIPTTATVLTFVGALRPYKGALKLAHLVSSTLPSDKWLLMGGQPTPEVSQELAKFQSCKNVFLRPVRLDDKEFELFIQASDFVVLPFSASLHSSSIVHCLSLGRAVLTAHTPYAALLRELVGEDWVQLIAGDVQKSDLDELRPPPGTPNLSVLEPTSELEPFSKFYRSLID